MLFVVVADGHVATPIILCQWHNEVWWPAPFSAVVRLPVTDQYPMMLGEPKSELRAISVVVRAATMKQNRQKKSYKRKLPIFLKNWYNSEVSFKRNFHLTEQVSHTRLMCHFVCIFIIFSLHLACNRNDLEKARWHLFEVGSYMLGLKNNLLHKVIYFW